MNNFYFFLRNVAIKLLKEQNDTSETKIGWETKDSCGLSKIICSQPYIVSKISILREKVILHGERVTFETWICTKLKDRVLE